MQIVEYTPTDNLTRGLISRRVVRSDMRTHEEAVAEVKRMLVDLPVQGYNEEADYFWARRKTPSTEVRRILRVEA